MSQVLFSHSTENFAHPHRNVEALHIEPGMTIADFGAGSGAYVYAMAKRLSGLGTVYAIDVQRDLLRRIQNESQQRGLRTVKVLWCDLERPLATQLPNDSVDMVLISNLLFQVENKDALFFEAMRILRPRGRVVLIDWFESFGNMGPIKQEVVPREVAGRMAEESGFVFEYEFEAGAHHYGLVFLKPVRG